MKKIFVDTNLFMRYLTNDIPTQIDKVERLFDLAEKEMNNIFFNIPNKTPEIIKSSVDAVILLDLSFKTAVEWESIKKGIKNFANAISHDWSIDTVINIFPVSDKYSASKKFTGIKSLPGLRKALSTLMPGGDKSINSRYWIILPGSFQNFFSRRSP